MLTYTNYKNSLFNLFKYMYHPAMQRLLCVFPSDMKKEGKRSFSQVFFVFYQACASWHLKRQMILIIFLEWILINADKPQTCTCRSFFWRNLCLAVKLDTYLIYKENTRYKLCHTLVNVFINYLLTRKEQILYVFSTTNRKM